MTKIYCCKKFCHSSIIISRNKSGLQYLLICICQLHTRLASALKDLQEEKQMNKCLLENQQVWQKKVTVLEGKVHDLTQNKEQVISQVLLNTVQIYTYRYMLCTQLKCIGSLCYKIGQKMYIYESSLTQMNTLIFCI